MPTLNDLLTARIPPHNAEAERAVLGACLESGAAALAVIATAGGLEGDAFYFDRHQRLFTAIGTVARAGQAVTLVTVQAALRAADDLDAVGLPCLAQCLEEAGLLAHLPSYVALVREAAVKRAAIRMATEVIARAYAPGAVSEVLDAVRDGLGTLHATQDGPGRALAPPADPQSIREVLATLWTQLDTPETDFVRSPIPELDARLGGGLLIGEYAVLGGRPGTSKTALAVQWGALAAQAGQPTLIISREMKNAALAHRLLAQECHVSATALRQHDLDPEERRRIDRAWPRLSALPLWFDDQATTIPEIRRQVRTLRPRFLVVDYVQLVRAPEAAKQQRRLEVTAVSAGLKAIAHEMGCCSVLALSSLRRPQTEIAGRGKTRGPKRTPPTLEDLKESGDIEADADVVLLLWQPSLEHYDREIVFAKLRHGQTGGSTALDWDPVHVRFSQLGEVPPAVPSALPLDPDDPRNEVPF